MRQAIYRKHVHLKGITEDDKTVKRDLICKELEDPVILGMNMFPELRKCKLVSIENVKAMQPRAIAVYERRTREEIRKEAEGYAEKADRSRGIRMADWYRGEKPGPLSYMPRFGEAR